MLHKLKQLSTQYPYTYPRLVAFYEDLSSDQLIALYHRHSDTVSNIKKQLTHRTDMMANHRAWFELQIDIKSRVMLTITQILNYRRTVNHD
jgi:hypothetical protein